MGRGKDVAHRYFTETKVKGRSFSTCLGCGGKVSTHVVRLRKHTEKCTLLHASPAWQRGQSSTNLTHFVQTGRRDDDHLMVAKALISSNTIFQRISIENAVITAFYLSVCLFAIQICLPEICILPWLNANGKGAYANIPWTQANAK